MLRLIRSLVHPYRGTLLIILVAMLVQTAMSVAGPWPLKIILDNVVGAYQGTKTSMVLETLKHHTPPLR